MEEQGATCRKVSWHQGCAPNISPCQVQRTTAIEQWSCHPGLRLREILYSSDCLFETFDLCVKAYAYVLESIHSLSTMNISAVKALYNQYKACHVVGSISILPRSTRMSCVSFSKQASYLLLGVEKLQFTTSRQSQRSRPMCPKQAQYDSYENYADLLLHVECRRNVAVDLQASRRLA